MLAAGLILMALTIPEQPALTDSIRTRDAQFFQIFFEQCDPKAVRAMLTDDFEMYHDRDGVVARSAAPFVKQYARSCEARKKPDAWRSRRELVASSLKVTAIPGYGAIEEGDHNFYERKGDGPEKKVGTAHFVQLWVLGKGGWKLSRVFSYAHGAASD